MELENKVKNIIMDKLGVEEGKITPEASFGDDLNVDSLAQMQLVMAFEDEFGVTIPDEEAQQLTTVGKAMDYLKEKIESNQ